MIQKKISGSVAHCSVCGARLEVNRYTVPLDPDRSLQLCVSCYTSNCEKIKELITKINENERQELLEGKTAVNPGIC